LEAVLLIELRLELDKTTEGNESSVGFSCLEDQYIVLGEVYTHRTDNSLLSGIDDFEI
jgi:hypothetical protein